MLNFHIFTIFPEVFEAYLNSSILKRAQRNNLIGLKIYNIRDFSSDKHRTVDDKPFGGGPGMVLKAEPIIKAVNFVFNKKNKKRRSKLKLILLSPSGRQFDQKMARGLAKRFQEIALICGHYEGIDERVKRVLKKIGYKLQEVSIGPYILTGGELPAMVVIDAVVRHLPGVLGKEESLEEKKGSYPVYTRPDVFYFQGEKYSVPKVLLSGNHQKINEWRKKHSKSKFII